MRTMTYRRKARINAISRRKQLIKTHSTHLAFLVEPFSTQGIIVVPADCKNRLLAAVYGNKPGLLAKHDYGAITLGQPIKTKTKNATSSYRHKGGYGPACDHSRHDKQQLTKAKQSLFDYDNAERV